VIFADMVDGISAPLEERFRQRAWKSSSKTI